MLRSLLNNKIRKVLLLSLCSIIYGTASSQQINWQKLPFSLNLYPRFFYFDSLSNNMIIGGNFWKVNSTSTDLFMWDSSNVSFFKGSLIPDLPFTALRLNGKDLFLGGAYGLYYYNDTDWIKIDTNGNSNEVETLYQYNNQLLIGGVFGDFQFPDKQYAPISKFENDTWRPLYGIDTFLNKNPKEISKIISYKNELYAGGNIDHTGAIKEIIRWNGNVWTDLGGGIPGNGIEWVNDMTIYKGELYVCGRFLRSFGAADNNIERWDGTMWKPVGGGVNGQISSMVVFNNELWVIGNFNTAGGIPADAIAKWDGNKWYGFGNIFDNGLTCIGIYKNELYLGGGFWSIDGDTSISYIAKWIGGNFTDTSGSIEYTGFNEEVNNNSLFQIFPNPVNNKLNLEIPFERDGYTVINIYDINGRIIQTNKFMGHQGIDKFTIDISALSIGMYFIAVMNDNNYSGKFVKQ